MESLLYWHDLGWAPLTGSKGARVIICPLDSLTQGHSSPPPLTAVTQLPFIECVLMWKISVKKK